MKPSYRILFSIYITFIVYSTVFIIWGPAGIVQTSKLNTYKDKLIQNTTELSQINSKLVLQSNRLRTDQGLIALKARELGFFEGGEGKIIIKGYHINNVNFSIGSYYKKFNIKMANVNSFRIFSSIVGLFVYFLLTIFKKNTPVYKKRF